MTGLVSVIPHQGQGASQALEDAEALGAFLHDTAPENVPAALERVFRVRYRRATRIQKASRESGLHQSPKDVMTAVQEITRAHRYFGARKWEEEMQDQTLTDGEAGAP
jgi:salicylate hydroxylase